MSGVIMNRYLVWLLIVATMAVTAPRAFAQDAALATIHATLEPMRAGVKNDMRGATPALMDVKHGLRDWIERHLQELPADGDEHVFAARLNHDLQQADLFCAAASDLKKDRCDHSPDADWSATGYVEAVRLERQERLLFVRTRVGILCGGDDSAYAYERIGDRWRRIWADEQSIASGVEYRPQDITGFRVSGPDRRSPERLLLLLGHETWCTSNWYRVYFRLWRLRPGDAGARLLFDGAEPAFFAKEPPLEGSVSDNDATVEYTAGSLDPDFHSYEAVRRYEIRGDTVVRGEPVALGPRGFTEEWLRRDWADASAWAPPDSRAALQVWHARLDRGRPLTGEYIGDHTQRCSKGSDLWQVGIGFGAADKPKSNAFFLVRWEPPYRFQMVAIRSKPRADCSEADKSADADRTLFQDWR
jgi:hypothetical protein